MSGEAIARRWLMLFPAHARLHLRGRASCLLALSSIFLEATAAYPERPIRFVVALPPGGSPDLLARTIASGLNWRESIVVENRTSGGRNLAAEMVARSAPDGYTWMLVTDNILTANPHLGTTPFDPFRDFTPVTLVARLQFLLVVHPAVPARTVQELVALAKAKPGYLNYGSSGNG